MTQRDVRDLETAYERAGFIVRRDKGHHKVFRPSGQLVTTLTTSKCKGRADQNAKAKLRQAIRQGPVPAA
jgi:hypothetical protein